MHLDFFFLSSIPFLKYYTLCSLYTDSNSKAKWNNGYAKYRSCQILVIICFDSSYPLPFFSIYIAILSLTPITT